MLFIGTYNLMAIALTAGIMIIRAGEYRIHRYQRQFLTYMGGRETGRAWMTAYYSLEGIAIGVMVIELLLLAKPNLPIWQRLVGLGLLTLGAVLRHWGRRTMGRTWSLMLIYVPQIPRVIDGPYRFMRHPEYLSRYLELLGFSVFFGSYFGFGIYLAGTLMVLPQILVLEKRQLRQLGTEP